MHATTTTAAAAVTYRSTRVMQPRAGHGPCHASTDPDAAKSAVRLAKPRTGGGSVNRRMLAPPRDWSASEIADAPHPARCASTLEEVGVAWTTLVRPPTGTEQTDGQTAKEIALRIRDERPHQDPDRNGEGRASIRSGCREPLRQRGLWILSQFVDLRDAVHAADGAVRRAFLHAVVLPPQVVGAVIVQWRAWPAALLRAPVHESVLTDIQVTTAGPAVPVVCLATGEIFLKAVVVGEVEDGLSSRDDLLEHRAVPLVEGE